MQPTVELINESNLLIRVGNTLNPSNISLMINLENKIKQALGPALTDSIQAFTSLMICIDPLALSPFDAKDIVEKLLLEPINSTVTLNNKTISLPVFYDPSVGYDLSPLAEALNLSIANIITIHSNSTYDVYSLGFSPGFAFMGTLDERLVLPRKNTPRQKVPAGSVAIAEQQTTIYPNTTPGGWHIIGRCPTELFNTENTPANLLAPGQKVRFKSIDKKTFLSLGGKLDD